jgi:hypothetical protein
MTQRPGRSFFYYVALPFTWIGKGLTRIAKPTQRGKTRWAVFAILLLAAASASHAYPQAWDRGADFYNAQVVDRLKLPAGFKLPHFWNVNYKLGLDLQGGTHLVYEADTKDIPESERADALEGVRDVIERRVNAFGVAEPIVQTNKAGDRWRIIVELAGVRDVREAIKMIGETPILEFKEENLVEQIPLTAEEEKELARLNAEVKTKAEDELKRIKAGEGVTTWENLGLVTEAMDPELWKWADTHRPPRVRSSSRRPMPGASST